MVRAEYAAFLPPDWPQADGSDLPEPESHWWSWHEHEVHLLRNRRAESPVRLLVVHGAGGHSGALWSLVAPLADRFDVTAVDLPLYGRTRCPDPSTVRYRDWVELLEDLIADEDDGRPLVLLGASVGGMLAYEAAARGDLVTEVVATCLLDPCDRRVRARITRFGPLGVLGGAFAAVVPGWLARRRIPISWAAPLSRMSRQPGLSELCRLDPLGGGARIPIGFLVSYLRFGHAPPERMRTPVTLVQPARDAWTPPELSLGWLRRIAAPTRFVLLPECGHFPVEEPGVRHLLTTLEAVIAEAGRRDCPASRG